MPFIALGVGGIITGLVGAKMQSNAANKATDAQTAAGEKALALQSQIYNTTRGDLGPYREAGVTALNDQHGLMALLGLPVGAGMAPAGGPVGQGLGTGQAMDPGYNAAQANFDRFSPTGGYIGKDMPMSEKMTNPNVTIDSSGYTARQHGADPNQAIPKYKVRTPDGTVVQVPADKLADAVQHGGTSLGQV